MTRSRPNRKNDNARVEERNLHVVREFAGYQRLDDAGYVKLLNRIYRAHNLLVNHFQTWQRVSGKQRRGSKVIRIMDKPRTPYERVMEHLKDGGRKERLRTFHDGLNPWELRAEMQTAMTALVRRIESVALGHRGGRPDDLGQACKAG